MFVNPWFEEGIVRGYVMTELQELTGSRVIAILASTGLQTAYHLYQGPLNAVVVGACFLMFSIYYSKSGKLLPLIAAHTFMDLAALGMLVHSAGRH